MDILKCLKKMFNKKIKIILNQDFKKFKKIKFKYLIYTGTPDSYFNYKYGKLEWRLLI